MYTLQHPQEWILSASVFKALAFMQLQFVDDISASKPALDSPPCHHVKLLRAVRIRNTDGIQPLPFVYLIQSWMSSLISTPGVLQWDRALGPVGYAAIVISTAVATEVFQRALCTGRLRSIIASAVDQGQPRKQLSKDVYQAAIRIVGFVHLAVQVRLMLLFSVTLEILSTRQDLRLNMFSFLLNSVINAAVKRVHLGM